MLHNQLVGDGEHALAAPLNVATAKLVTHLERRVAGIEKDLGVTYRFKLPNKLCETLKEGNQQFNQACKACKGKKTARTVLSSHPPLLGICTTATNRSDDRSHHTGPGNTGRHAHYPTSPSS